jgi:hypothetical protein
MSEFGVEFKQRVMMMNPAMSRGRMFFHGCAGVGVSPI